MEIKDIKPGDLIQLTPLKVVKSLFTRCDQVAVLDSDNEPCFFTLNQIAAHHPMRDEVEKGDLVSAGGTRVGTVEHIARGRARVLWDHGIDTLTAVAALVVLKKYNAETR
jgi:hypothetical protein